MVEVRNKTQSQTRSRRPDGTAIGETGEPSLHDGRLEPLPSFNELLSHSALDLCLELPKHLPRAVASKKAAASQNALVPLGFRTRREVPNFQVYHFLDSWRGRQLKILIEYNFASDCEKSSDLHPSQLLRIRLNEACHGWHL